MPLLDYGKEQVVAADLNNHLELLPPGSTALVTISSAQALSL